VRLPQPKNRAQPCPISPHPNRPRHPQNRAQPTVSLCQRAQVQTVLPQQTHAQAARRERSPCIPGRI
jgi:hypothetical protein